jgi:hypothetical protein
MNTKLGKFLCVGVFLNFYVTAGLAQSYPPGTANMGEIKSKDMDTYHDRMVAAMAITEPRRRDEAIIQARQKLALDTRKPIAAGTIAEVDGLLDIGGVSPQLGASAQ